MKKLIAKIIMFIKTEPVICSVVVADAAVVAAKVGIQLDAAHTAAAAVLANAVAGWAARSVVSPANGAASK